MNLRIVCFFSLSTGLAFASSPVPVPQVSAPQWIVPPRKVETGGPLSVDHLPPEVRVNQSNNNVAVFIDQEEKRIYLAFRSADHHWAMPVPILMNSGSGEPVRMFVISSPFDPANPTQFQWRYEFEAGEELRKILGPLTQQMEAQFFKSVGQKISSTYYSETLLGKSARTYILLSLGMDVLQNFKKDVEKIVPPGSTVSQSDVRKFHQLLNQYFLTPDLREPIFAKLGNRLTFYFLHKQRSLMSFLPIRSWAVQKPSGGDWESPRPILTSTEILYEVKTREGNAGEPAAIYASSYKGAHYETDSRSEKVQVYLKKSYDGLTFEPAGTQDFVYEGGGNEMAFEFASDGRLWSVIRQDDGDAQRGWGSIIAHSEGAVDQWVLPERANPYRYDEPRMFSQDGEIYLVSRQNINHETLDESENAPFDLSFRNRTDAEGEIEREKVLNDVRAGRVGNKNVKPTALWEASDPWNVLGVFNHYEALNYWLKDPKRTAIYHLNQENARLDLLVTLPSAGDTGFPSVARINDKELLIANYSSPFEEKKRPWGGIFGRGGQNNPTGIYFVRVKFQ